MKASVPKDLGDKDYDWTRVCKLDIIFPLLLSSTLIPKKNIGITYNPNAKGTLDKQFGAKHWR